VDLSGVEPRPPLAIDSSLSGSAGFHADEMAVHDYFAHRSEVTGDWPNEMARDHGYVLPWYYENEANYIESIGAGTRIDTAVEILDLLIVDEGLDPPGHREHLLSIGTLNERDREIGIGYAARGTAAYTNYWAMHITHSDPSDTFLTGVVFDDLNHDLKYNEGEGLSGVTITAGTHTTTTNAAGGWSIQVVPGQYTVTAFGGGFVGTSSAAVTVDSDNVEVDFVSRRPDAAVNFSFGVGPIDQIGLHRNRNFLLDVNGNGRWNRPAGGDMLYAFGSPGDIPLVGDWNGDGFDEIGSFNPGNLFFYLDRNANGRWDGPAGGDLQYRLGGRSTDTPLVGDWNGDGVDEIGVFRNRNFLVDFNANGRWDRQAGGDRVFAFGAFGDLPLIGDWNGDGTDDVGTYRSGNTKFYVDANGSGRWDAGDVGHRFRSAVETPLAGDWDGDGDDDIGTYDSGNLSFYLDASGNGRWEGAAGGDVYYRMGGTSTDAPVTGKWASPQPLLAAAAPPTSSLAPFSKSPIQPLASADLTPIVDRAIDIWSTGSLTAAQRETLQRVTAYVTELPGDMLGQALGETIWVDADAAGRGWRAFQDAGRNAKGETPMAVPHAMDLLTVVVHELGHLLGHDHTQDGVMRPTLQVGTNRLDDEFLPELDDVWRAGELSQTGGVNPRSVDALFARAL
jgi:hypothetical protein